jgi:hypothetical protein
MIPVGPFQWRTQVQNPSAEPIHEVAVRVADADLPRAFVGSPVGTGTTWSQRATSRFQRSVPVPLVSAGASYLFASEIWPEEQSDALRPVCFFTDNNGVRWRRDEFGDLREVDPDQPQT